MPDSFHYQALFEFGLALGSGFKTLKPSDAVLSGFVMKFEPDFRDVLAERGEAKWRLSAEQVTRRARALGMMAEAYAASDGAAEVTEDNLYRALGQVKPDCTAFQGGVYLEFCRQMPMPR